MAFQGEAGAIGLEYEDRTERRTMVDAMRYMMGGAGGVKWRPGSRLRFEFWAWEVGNADFDSNFYRVASSRTFCQLPVQKPEGGIDKPFTVKRTPEAENALEEVTAELRRQGWRRQGSAPNGEWFEQRWARGT